MTYEQTIRLLRMVYSLFTAHQGTAADIGNDLFDFVEENTKDELIKYQIQSARIQGYDRLETVRYLKFRLNF